MRYRLHHDLPTPEACEAFAATALGEGWLNPGDCLGLDGPLGAGKTTLTQAIGKALGITEPITSPTFGLLHRYTTGRFPLVHLDWYRLGSEPREDLLWELDEVIQTGDALVVMEWPCLVPELVVDALTHYLTLTLDEATENRRLNAYSLKPWPGRTEQTGGVSVLSKLNDSAKRLEGRHNNE